LRVDKTFSRSGLVFAQSIASVAATLLPQLGLCQFQLGEDLLGQSLNVATLRRRDSIQNAAESLDFIWEASTPLAASARWVRGEIPG
jgi:hypothetical protein